MITSTRTLPPFIRMAHFGALRRPRRAWRGRWYHRHRQANAGAGERRAAGWHPIGARGAAPRRGLVSGRDGAPILTATAPVRQSRPTGTRTISPRPSERPSPRRRLVQAIGRVRGVNRTAENPVEVVLLGNVPVPGLVLDSVRPWQAPSVDDEILARHGVEIGVVPPMRRPQPGGRSGR